MNYVCAEYNLLSLHQAVLFNDLRRLRVLYISRTSVYHGVRAHPTPCIALQCFSLLPHSSFNSNSLPLADSSPPYIFWLVTFSFRQLASLCSASPPRPPKTPPTTVTTSSSTPSPFFILLSFPSQSCSIFFSFYSMCTATNISSSCRT